RSNAALMDRAFSAKGREPDASRAHLLPALGAHSKLASAVKAQGTRTRAIRTERPLAEMASRIATRAAHPAAAIPAHVVTILANHAGAVAQEGALAHRGSAAFALPPHFVPAQEVVKERKLPLGPPGQLEPPFQPGHHDQGGVGQPHFDAGTVLLLHLLDSLLFFTSELSQVFLVLGLKETGFLFERGQGFPIAPFGAPRT